MYTCWLTYFLGFWHFFYFDKETQWERKKDLNSKIIQECSIYFKDKFCKKYLYLLGCFVIFYMVKISILRG